MVDAVAGLLADLFGASAERATLVTCVHNFVRREQHLGEELWVHRKGAISADPGEPGIIPGSMGAPSYHVEGRGCEGALRSSSHGAGRCLSRSEARRRISVADVRRQLRGVWFDVRQAERLRDEAPAAYKDISKVMRAQRELTRVVRAVRPILSYKCPDG
jgi:tRNA-splicing ligase RtcB